MRRKAEAKSELDEEKAVMAADIDVLRKKCDLALYFPARAAAARLSRSMFALKGIEKLSRLLWRGLLQVEKYRFEEAERERLKKEEVRDVPVLVLCWANAAPTQKHIWVEARDKSVFVFVFSSADR
ncbi:hypothetical protein CYMTET_17349 [Cymbomonas tetramitiformis]|uniref:Uncharacterized protein n=1 Tax=Cymbomonas tetramitiformis TaxID=36881 RepID=A0AAE0GAB8_9CHLO|nr:hypothetical protein CYMTET_17349 [Cymbomonas tetramitiformis]